jgi:tryptophanyl-tRNA synthetase
VRRPGCASSAHAGDRRQLAGRRLDPEKVFFYRQSDIPEIPELTWLLTCVTGKGLLNRAHAYKAAVDKNTAAGATRTADVTAGLFMYPVLMAADILMFKAHKCPWGATRSSTSRWRATWRQLQPPVRRAFRAARGRDRRQRGHAARPGRPQDEQELRQHHPAVRAARAAAQADHGHRHRFARAGRAQGHRRLGPVPDLPGLCQRRGNRRLRKAFADGIAWGDAKQMLFERIDGSVIAKRTRVSTSSWWMAKA